MPLFSPEATLPYAESVAAKPEPRQTESSGGIGIWPYVALIAGNAADGLTTQMALAHGAQEANPILGGNRALNLALKAAGTAGLALAIRKLAKTRPTAAKWLAYGDGAGMGAVAASNLRQSLLRDMK